MERHLVEVQEAIKDSKDSKDSKDDQEFQEFQKPSYNQTKNVTTNNRPVVRVNRFMKPSTRPLFSKPGIPKSPVNKEEQFINESIQNSNEDQNESNQTDTTAAARDGFNFFFFF